jgi:hypothetical protein
MADQRVALLEDGGIRTQAQHKCSLETGRKLCRSLVFTGQVRPIPKLRTVKRKGMRTGRHAHVHARVLTSFTKKQPCCINVPLEPAHGNVPCRREHWLAGVHTGVYFPQLDVVSGIAPQQWLREKVLLCESYDYSAHTVQ